LAVAKEIHFFIVELSVDPMEESLLERQVARDNDDEAASRRLVAECHPRVSRAHDGVSPARNDVSPSGKRNEGALRKADLARCHFQAMSDRFI
jgi:hypothetical protein